jgi:hypothetical protein
MIPMMNIIAWSNVVPWAEQRQVEQDLIISRAIVNLFADPFLREQLRFRGGTALNKLHFPAPIRYSEDIDLVRTTSGPIGRSSAASGNSWSHGSAAPISSKARLPRNSDSGRRRRIPPQQRRSV